MRRQRLKGILWALAAIFLAALAAGSLAREDRPSRRLGNRVNGLFAGVLFVWACDRAVRRLRGGSPG
jgi:hypothetical protein